MPQFHLACLLGAALPSLHTGWLARAHQIRCLYCFTTRTDALTNIQTHAHAHVHTHSSDASMRHYCAKTAGDAIASRMSPINRHGDVSPVPPMRYVATSCCTLPICRPVAVPAYMLPLRPLAAHAHPRNCFVNMTWRFLDVYRLLQGRRQQHDMSNCCAIIMSVLLRQSCSGKAA